MGSSTPKATLRYNGGLQETITHTGGLQGPTHPFIGGLRVGKGSVNLHRWVQHTGGLRQGKSIMNLNRWAQGNVKSHRWDPGLNTTFHWWAPAGQGHRKLTPVGSRRALAPSDSKITAKSIGPNLTQPHLSKPNLNSHRWAPVGVGSICKYDHRQKHHI